MSEESSIREEIEYTFSSYFCKHEYVDQILSVRTGQVENFNVVLIGENHHSSKNDLATQYDRLRGIKVGKTTYKLLKNCLKTLIDLHLRRRHFMSIKTETYDEIFTNPRSSLSLIGYNYSEESVMIKIKNSFQKKTKYSNHLEDIDNRLMFFNDYSKTFEEHRSNPRLYYKSLFFFKNFDASDSSLDIPGYLNKYKDVKSKRDEIIDHSFDMILSIARRRSNLSYQESVRPYFIFLHIFNNVDDRDVEIFKRCYDYYLFELYPLNLIDVDESDEMFALSLVFLDLNVIFTILETMKETSKETQVYILGDTHVDYVYKTLKHVTSNAFNFKRLFKSREDERFLRRSDNTSSCSRSDIVKCDP